jgi:hypothetical protein
VVEAPTNITDKYIYIFVTELGKWKLKAIVYRYKNLSKTVKPEHSFLIKFSILSNLRNT